MDRAHRPNVVGCGIGFATAGAGIGSFVGMAIGGQVCRDLPGLVDQPDTRALLIYLWLFRGVLGGLAVGAAVGLGYALLRRWLAWETGSEPRP